MTIENRVINGGFETGTFSPWVPSNATITSQFSHSGSFAARLLGGNVNSFIFQYVEANPTERFEFLVSLAKVGPLTSPPVSLSVAYYNASFGFLGYGLITNIPSSRLPNVEDETWLEVYETTSPAPLGTTQALVLINKLPQAGSADVIVDDVALLAVEDVIGPTGATGINQIGFNQNPTFIELPLMGGTPPSITTSNVILNGTQQVLILGNYTFSYVIPNTGYQIGGVVRILRNNGTIYSFSFQDALSGFAGTTNKELTKPFNINIIDSPPAGTFNYSIDIAFTTFGGIPARALLRVRNRSIQAIVISV